jgi:thiol-disulfide isomerase/thioredoxin
MSCYLNSSESFSQDYAKINDYDSIIYHLKADSVKKDSIIVYSVNASDIQELVKKSKKYTLVYIYAYWCTPCRKETPKVVEWAKANEDVNLLLINTDKEKDYTYTLEYLQKLSYFYPSFTVSESYGKGRMKKFENFLEDLCPTCQVKKMGYSSCILLDNEENVLFHSTYETLNQMEEVKRIVSEN